MGRQVITASSIEQARKDGLTELHVADSAIVTAVAAEAAQEHNIRIVRGGRATVPSGPDEPTEATSLSVSNAGTSEPTSGPASRADVRAAVIAALGEEPEGLDAALTRVMGR